MWKATLIAVSLVFTAILVAGLLLIALLPMCWLVRRARLRRRTPTPHLSTKYEYDDRARDIEGLVLEAVANSVGVQHRQLRLDDRLDVELALCHWTVLRSIASSLEMGWEPVEDEITEGLKRYNLQTEKIVVKLEGTLQSSIDAILHNVKRGSE